MEERGRKYSGEWNAEFPTRMATFNAMIQLRLLSSSAATGGGGDSGDGAVGGAYGVSGGLGGGLGGKVKLRALVFR